MMYPNITEETLLEYHRAFGKENFENIHKDFLNAFKRSIDSGLLAKDLQGLYFTVYISGFAAALEPGSNFNKNFKLPERPDHENR